jgi:hypothetical protein
MDTNQVGALSEGKVMSALISAGYTVAIPFGVAKYDLIVERPRGNFQRIQCKTGRLRNGTVRFNAYSLRGTRTQKYGKILYQGEADFFGVYCSELDKVYLVPVQNQRSEVSLRVDPAKTNVQVNWAKDYEI